MNKGKSVGTDSGTGSREFIKWTEDMDEKLLNALIEEARLGNMVDGSWTTQAYNNIVTNLNQLGFASMTKNNVKNRQKVLKEKWREVHDLFSSLSGFAWSSLSMRFEAEEEV